MGGGGNTEATFVSDISSDVSLGSKVIKTNTTFCGATKLVILLITSTLVSALAVDAILKVDTDTLFGTQSQTSARKGGNEHE